MSIGNVHLSLPSQPTLDLYGGLSLGIVCTSFSFDGNAPGLFDSASNSDTGLGMQIGAQYALTPRAMGFAQLGAYDIPLLYGGVWFKF